MAVTLTAAGGFAGPAQAATGLPCDIYQSAGTPCVAAHSTTRALFTAYNGPLYQVRRADGQTLNIGLLSPGGYANAAAQDAFCANSNCVITVIYDQSPNHNDLSIEGPGGTVPTADEGSDAAALPIHAGGHPVYGVYIGAGMGYRNNHTTGVATAGHAEGMYMIASGTHVNGGTNQGCCYDYGNAETSGADTGNGHMDALNLSYTCVSPCTGAGPWVEADLENGLFQGGNGSATTNTPVPYNFVTAMLKNNGHTTGNIGYALKGGNAQSGALTTLYSGQLPTQPGYNPSQQEGAIVLGTGGDNSNWSVGSFFEGVMTSGYPTDAADNAVQANITSVSYSGASGGGAAPASTIAGPGGQCVDVNGPDSGIDGTAVQLWNCQTDAIDQHWRHNSDQSLSTLGRCLDILNDSTAAGTQVQLYDCNGNGGQKWVQQTNGSLLNPQSGLCLDDPNGNTANGTQLRIWPCNGASAQGFTVTGGGTVASNGGQCVDVAGDDNGGNASSVQLWNCQSYAVDQHWTHNSDGTVRTLGRCLDVTGNVTAAGALVELYDCNGHGGQQWTQQSNGALLNPASGLCLDDPNGTTTNGTQLRIWPCNGASAQTFRLS